MMLPIIFHMQWGEVIPTMLFPQCMESYARRKRRHESYPAVLTARVPAHPFFTTLMFAFCYCHGLAPFVLAHQPVEIELYWFVMQGR